MLVYFEILIVIIYNYGCIFINYTYYLGYEMFEFVINSLHELTVLKHNKKCIHRITHKYKNK